MIALDLDVRVGQDEFSLEVRDSADVQVVGLIEGVAEATASFVKIYGGRLSDRYARRKPFVIAGYSLSAVSKPLLALAGTAAQAEFSQRSEQTTAGAWALIGPPCGPRVRGRCRPPAAR